MTPPDRPVSAPATEWRELAARAKRTMQQRAEATAIVKERGWDEIEVLPIGEYAVAFGYVALFNDMRSALTTIAAGRWGPGSECVWCMGPSGGHIETCAATLARAALDRLNTEDGAGR